MEPVLEVDVVVKLLSIICILGILTTPFASDGESSLELSYEYFLDKNQVICYAPILALTLSINEFWSVSFDQEIDAVTGASRYAGYNEFNQTSPDASSGATHQLSPLDGLTGATKPEVRYAETISISRADQGRVVGASFYMSHEDDYTSYAPSVNISWDFNERNTTVAGGYSHFFDHYLSRPNFPPGGKKNIHSANASLTQSLSPLTIISLSGNYIDSRGFLGHPYRPVILDSGAIVDEKVPDQKTGIALSANIIQGYHLFDDYLGSINVHYRNYQDNWGMLSHTIDTKWYQYITEESYIRLRYRYYQQGSHDFIYATYSEEDKYRSADIRYYPFSSNLFGLKFSFAFPDSWQEASFLVPSRWRYKIDYLFRSTKENTDLYQDFNDRLWHTAIDRAIGVGDYYSQVDMLIGVQYDF